jgi:sugar transferase (PEP-CTERM system associated)
MVRLFQVYYPVRTLMLIGGEAALIGVSFLLATAVIFGADSYIILNYEQGAQKIFFITLCTVVCSYYFDLYSPAQLANRNEIYFRLLIVISIVSFLIAAIALLYPGFLIGRNVQVLGLAILTFVLSGWRTFYEWILSRPALRERVYVLGSGPRAASIVEAIRGRAELGMEVVGWAGALGGSSNTREELTEALRNVAARVGRLDRIIVALQDRRSTMPVRELLDRRLSGVIIEDATTLLEKVSGKIDLNGLHPSALIFSEGFHLSRRAQIVRRVVAIVFGLVVLTVTLPILPVVAVAVRFSSPGPILFSQKRVGRKGEVFTVHKFRTMRQDAEAATGAVWAGQNDPRVTRIGRFLRKTRLDELPQLWNVLKGDMALVGPRPERPEFVHWLQDEVPYYGLRHIISPGLTGWAQTNYRYGASLEDTKRKLEYDLYYIKHMSLALDLLIIFETIKTVLLRRGAQ